MAHLYSAATWHCQLGSTSMIIRCSPHVNRPTVVSSWLTRPSPRTQRLFPVDWHGHHRVHNDLVRAADADRVTVIVLLDLSSAFGTVDHHILLSVLERRFGVDGAAFRWFQSYLQDRSQTFIVNGRSSRTHRVDCSVPQSSCLGSVEFITAYTEALHQSSVVITSTTICSLR